MQDCRVRRTKRSKQGVCNSSNVKVKQSGHLKKTAKEWPERDRTWECRKTYNLEIECNCRHCGDFTKYEWIKIKFTVKFFKLFLGVGHGQLSCELIVFSFDLYMSHTAILWPQYTCVILLISELYTFHLIVWLSLIVTISNFPFCLWYCHFWMYQSYLNLLAYPCHTLFNGFCCCLLIPDLNSYLLPAWMQTL